LWPVNQAQPSWNCEPGAVSAAPGWPVQWPVTGGRISVFILVLWDESPTSRHLQVLYHQTLIQPVHFLTILNLTFFDAGSAQHHFIASILHAGRFL